MLFARRRAGRAGAGRYYTAACQAAGAGAEADKTAAPTNFASIAGGVQEPKATCKWAREHIAAVEVLDTKAVVDYVLDYYIDAEKSGAGAAGRANGAAGTKTSPNQTVWVAGARRTAGRRKDNRNTYIVHRTPLERRQTCTSAGRVQTNNEDNCWGSYGLQQNKLTYRSGTILGGIESKCGRNLLVIAIQARMSMIRHGRRTAYGGSCKSTNMRMIRVDWKHDGTRSRGQDALSPPDGRGIDSVMLDERGVLQAGADGPSDRRSGQ
ncbi:hypothetical protein FB451DRAFT_1169898 [Mycena latifolia]|nr:hypothetical protein FB451DRAFT_1169898 [Mycena latifolia]